MIDHSSVKYSTVGGWSLSRGAVLIALVCSSFSNTEAKAEVTPMPLVPWDKEATEVKVTADGKHIPVGEWVPSGKTPNVRYCHFDTDAPVTVVVTQGRPGDKELAFATNDRTGILPERVDPKIAAWRFTMRPNTKVFLKSTKTFIVASAPDKNAPKPGDPTVVNIANLGIKPDAPESSTKAIQKAIDAAGQDPTKKVVYLPAGVYTSGTLFMRDGVTLYLAPGAVLRGSEDAAEWQHRTGPHYGGTSSFLFFGNDVEKDGKVIGVRNAAVRGRGVIDGWGHHFRREYVDDKQGNNPYYYEGDKTQKARLVFAMSAENCRIEGVTLRNPVFWTTHILASKAFDFTDVKVYANYRLNNDGLNYDGCTDSKIDNCVMITGDDSHCLKNEYVNGLGGPNERIRMANSITAGFGMGIKFGWAFHQAHDCVYENNWLVGGNFGIHVGRKPIRVAGPKISEVVNLTLRDMVIEGDLSVAVVGKAIDGYKLENLRIENSRVNGKVEIRNAKGVHIKGLTVAGKLVQGAGDLPGVTDNTAVTILAK